MVKIHTYNLENLKNKVSVFSEFVLVQHDLETCDFLYVNVVIVIEYWYISIVNVLDY